MTTPIPLTAWEQFGLVVLILLFAVAFLGGVWAFIRWILRWLDNITEKNNKSQHEFFDEQRDKQNQFIAEENAKTKQWLTEQECNTRKVIGQVTEGLEAVNDNLRQLAEDLRKHDANVPVLVQKAVDAVSKLPPIRRK